MKLNSLYFLLVCSFFLNTLSAQKPVLSMHGGVDYTFPIAKDRVFPPFEPNNSTGYKITLRPPNAIYNASDNLGYNFAGNVRFDLSERLSFSTGLGFQYRSFKFSVQVETIDKLLQNLNWEPMIWYGAIVNYPFVVDSTNNSTLKPDILSNRLLYLNMNIAELHYDFPRGIVSVFTGIHAQLLAWSSREYRSYDLETLKPGAITNDNSGSTYNSMIIGLSCGAEFRISRHLLVRAALSRSINDVFDRDMVDVNMKWNSASLGGVYEFNK
jgi:hypothetical protein